jgi:hypothetical protein
MVCWDMYVCYVAVVCNVSEYSYDVGAYSCAGICL